MVEFAIGARFVAAGSAARDTGLIAGPGAPLWDCGGAGATFVRPGAAAFIAGLLIGARSAAAALAARHTGLIAGPGAPL